MSLLVVIALLSALGALLVALALERGPPPGPLAPLTVEDLDRVRRIVRDNDPRWLRAGQTRQLTLARRDLDLALHHLLIRLRHPAITSARAELFDGSAWLRVGVAVPAGPLGGQMTVSLGLNAGRGEPSLAGARIGRIALPAWLVRAGLVLLETWAGQPALVLTLRELLATTSDWTITPQAISLRFVARPDLAWRLEARGRDLLLPPAERERIAHYLREAARLGALRPPVVKPLVPMLRELVAQAAARSRANGDPRAENRAALIALAIHVTGRADLIWRIVGTPPAGGRPGPVTLLDRTDLAQHLLVSAVLAMEADSRTADVIGVFKEVLDSRGGSGFSFADLAADRAGVRLGEAAQADPLRWQARVAALSLESDLMPAIDRLPEGLQAPEFQRRFQARDNAAYAQVQAEIERRLANCRFFATAAP